MAIGLADTGAAVIATARLSGSLPSQNVPMPAFVTRPETGNIMDKDNLSEQSGASDTLNSEFVQVLSDVPLTSSADDALDFLPYAEALAFLIDSKETLTPLIVAISAPWGSGKTSLANLVQNELRALGDWDARHIICSFNAWKHDDAAHLGAAFAADIAQQANKLRSMLRRLFQPLPSAMLTPEQSWRRRFYFIFFAVTATVLVLFGPGVGKVVSAAADPSDAHWTAAEKATNGYGLSIVIFLAAFVFLYPKVLSGTQAVARFIRAPQEEAAHGSMASVHDQLGQLIRQATRGRCRFVIFVDDLERCRPPRAVEVCEVASQLLNHPDVVTVLVADMEAITMSAALKYRDLEVPADSGGEKLKAAYMQYGRSYLQKLVQMQLDLPRATPDQLKGMLVAALRESKAPSPAIPSAKDRSWLYILAFAISLASAAIGFSSGKVKSYNLVLVLAISAIVFGVTGLVLYAVTISADLRARSRARKAREEIDTKIREQAAGMTVNEAVKKVSSDEQRVGPVSVQKRVFRAAIEPDIVSRADDLVFEFLPARPRGAKRLLNQVRLMMSIATARGMFVLPSRKDSSAEKWRQVQADRVGKWLVLNERWPDVAAAAADDAALMKRLEIADSDVAVRTVLELAGVTDIEDLGEFINLLKKTPKFESNPLSGVVPKTSDHSSSASEQRGVGSH